MSSRSSRDPVQIYPLDSERAHGAVCVNLPARLRAKLSLFCARAGMSEQAVIIDLVDDGIDAAIPSGEETMARPDDPKRYRDRAEECRTAAECMTDASARETMLRCADDYECWAVKVEQELALMAQARAAPKRIA